LLGQPTFTAAELQVDGMLRLIEGQQPFTVPVEQRGAGQHFGVEARAAGNEAQEVAAEAVGTLHHGRDAQTGVGSFCRLMVGVHTEF
jgi:hypothetical protein